MTAPGTGAEDTTADGVEQHRELASAVHEMRTPLATVQGFLETLLVRGDELDDDVRDHVTAIALRNAVLLGQRIETLLQYERLAAEAFDLHAVPQRLLDVVRTAVEDCSGVLGRHEVVIRVAPDLWAMVDQDALGHVLGNLLGNAAKHSPDGSTLTVRARRGESGSGTVAVTVEDEGEGITDEDLPHVFEAFYRGGDLPGSVGLGLAVVDRYVQLWGGSIGVHSRPGEGTRVTFTLPGAPAHVQDVAAVEQPSRHAS